MLCSSNTNSSSANKSFFFHVMFSFITGQKNNCLLCPWPNSPTRAWIYDTDSPVAASVAKRVECVTGLDTAQRVPDGPTSGEAFQVRDMMMMNVVMMSVVTMMLWWCLLWWWLLWWWCYGDICCNDDVMMMSIMMSVVMMTSVVMMLVLI